MHIFSVKKEKSSDPLQRIQQSSNPGEAKQVPMYCKHLIYKGTSEMSFEELRGASWNLRKEKKEKEKMQGSLI